MAAVDPRPPGGLVCGQEGERMTITLPDAIRDELERKARAAGFESVDQYVVCLILEADEAEGEGLSDMPVPEELVIKSREDLEAKLLASLDSGPPIKVDEAFWADLRRRVDERAKKYRPQS
jgi:hypothetical protein